MTDYKKKKTAPIVDLRYGRTPPQVLELEQAVLGACMLEKMTFAQVLDIIQTPNCFYSDQHQKVFAAMRRLHENGIPVDLLTIAAELRKSNELDLIGGPYFLTQLTESVLSSAHVEAHSRIVMEKFLARELIRISGQTLSMAYEDSADVFELMDEHETELVKLVSGNLKTEYKNSATLAYEATKRLEMLANNPSHLTGVTTGFSAMDALTCGWQPGAMIIVAARPSVGKTAFMLNLALNAAKSGTGVGIFSLEMSADQLTNRCISILGQVDFGHVTRGKLQPCENELFNKGAFDFAKLNIQIDDNPALNIFELRARARRMKQKHDVGIIMIDYLQLMRGVESKGNREQEISKISRDLKALAKELQVPVIPLSQLSRGVESRAGQKPMLSDLRESGAIEQDADTVIFLSRPDYQKKEHETDPMVKDDVTVDFAKHRNGRTDDLAMHFVKEIQTFFERYEYDQYRNPRAEINNSYQQPAPPAKKPRAFDIPRSPLPAESIDDLPF